MRIASVCRVLPTPVDPAAGAFVLRRLAAMAKLADVQVVQPVPYFPLVRPLSAWARAADYAADGVCIAHAPMFYVPAVLKSLDGWWLARGVGPHLRRLHALGPLHAIDAHFGYPDGVGCVRVARSLGVPAFVTIRGMEVDVLEQPRLRAQLLDALGSAAGCVCVSHSLRDVLVNRGVDPAAILVAPNAVDRAVFRPGSRAEARERLSLPRDRRIVVTVGHLVRGKRHDVLIRALARLHGNGWSDAELAIIGGEAYDATCPRDLEVIAAKAGVAASVRFVGKVHPGQVADWLRAADAFALATEREGCCNSVLEAVATGIPVVTTPAGDNPYFVTDDTNGQLVPIGDVEATAVALRRVLDRPWDAEAISRGLAVGDWDSVARRVLGFFAERIQVTSGERR